MGSQYGSTDLPRYWITLGKETIFDYPKHFIHSESPDENSRIAYEALSIYPYSSETSEISNMLREYIDTPLSELMTKRSLGSPDENSRIAYEALSIYPYSSETSEISNMLREYIDTPLSELMTKRSLGTHRHSSSRR